MTVVKARLPEAAWANCNANQSAPLIVGVFVRETGKTTSRAKQMPFAIADVELAGVNHPARLGQ